MSKKKQKKAGFRTMIGGQALIEGIMMRGPKKQAAVVRKPDGELEIKEEELLLIKDRYPILGVPFLRGPVNFVDSITKGMQTLMWSAEFYPEDEQPEEPSRFEQWLERRLGGEKAMRVVMTFAAVIGIGFSILLFFLLPALLTGFFLPFVENNILRNLIEGAIRILIFLAYLMLVSRMKDIRRVFAYHGAEHKTIFCYERGLPLTTENVRAQPMHHPRCGTSFLFVIMIVSILLFALLGFSWANPWLRVGVRLLMLPVVVSVTYEINRWVGRHDNFFTRIVTAPGLWLQNFTTNEPDDEMLAVGIRALTLVLPEEKGADAW